MNPSRADRPGSKDRPRHEGRPRRAAARALAAVLLAALTAAAASAQLSRRPEDPLGLSIREHRVRVIHSTTPEVPGTSMHLQQWDPWLAYQRGRSYYFREWGRDDGVFAAIPDRPEAASANSCGMCHNLPFPSVGSGGSVAIPVGVGRTAPHFFGGGLIETLGVQIRAQLLAAHDANRNGYLDVPAETAGRRAVVEATPGVEVDFGSLEDGDGDGFPDLDAGIMVRMVDEKGERVLWTQDGRLPRLGAPGIAGYDLAAGVFATSAGDHQFPSMRTFSTGVFVTIMGILPEGEVEHRGRYGGPMLMDWGRMSNAGAFQSEVVLTGDPFAEPDPARRATVTVGERDLLEWFMLNHPAPGRGPETAETRRGRQVIAELGCTSCHVPDWRIEPADPGRGLPGDRRFFHLDVRHDPERDRLTGRLIDLTREVPGPDGSTLRVPRREGFLVENVFTDFRHHDLGKRFYEYAYAGKIYVTRRFRTAHLWGVGSSVRLGHDGRSTSLDEVIRRHGGEAETAALAYAEAPEADREALIAFLRSLVLYPPELLPADLDGDGRIAERFEVAGREVGPEVFRPELMLRVPPRYQGWTEAPDGSRYFSYALQNVAEAYGEHLAALRDADRDGVPDLSEPAAATVAPAAPPAAPATSPAAGTTEAAGAAAGRR